MRQLRCCQAPRAAELRPGQNGTFKARTREIGAFQPCAGEIRRAQVGVDEYDARTFDFAEELVHATRADKHSVTANAAAPAPAEVPA